MKPLKDRLIFFFKAFGIAVRCFVRDDCITVSSSIAFVFLLAIIPFSALFLFTLNLLKNSFLTSLFSQKLVEIMVLDIHQVIPFITKEWVRAHLIDSVGLGSFTTFNLLMLPVISGLLFKSMEVSFRRIFQLERRTMIKGHLVYAAMSVFTILIFFMVNSIWTVLPGMTQPLQAYLDQNDHARNLYSMASGWSAHAGVDILSWLILLLFFITTVKLFLSAPIKLRHRVSAGVLFGLLWLIARQVFGFYIQHVSRINVLFGSLSSVCIILLWVFYSAITLLYSVEFMYVLHCGPYTLWNQNLRRKTKR